MLRHGSNGNQNGFRLSTVFYKAYHTDVKLMKLVANALKTTELSQRQLAEKIGVSHGTIDPIALAKKELAARGLDKAGKWVGFSASKKIHGLVG